jgi:hypothetical protein
MLVATGLTPNDQDTSETESAEGDGSGGPLGPKPQPRLQPQLGRDTGLTRRALPRTRPEVVSCREVHAKFPMFRCSTMRAWRERAASGRTLGARSTSLGRHWNGPFVVM